MASIISTLNPPYINPKGTLQYLPFKEPISLLKRSPLPLKGQGSLDPDQNLPAGEVELGAEAGVLEAGVAQAPAFGCRQRSTGFLASI